jgi:polyferredoxin
MRIVTTRRISQGFFLTIFLWFCVASTLGDRWWQLRGWPVNWLLQLDPLVGLGTLLTTGTVYAGLLWGLASLALTVILGRFFCGWMCPFGTMHQLTGYLAHRRDSTAARLANNRPRRGQAVKYYILVFLLSAAAVEASINLISSPFSGNWLPYLPVLLILLVLIAGILPPGAIDRRRFTKILLTAAAAALVAGFLVRELAISPASLQIGLLDPLALVYRSVNLTLVPFFERSALPPTPQPRLYEGVWLIGALFWTALWLNLWIPRFYCRFVCPLGALFGVCSRSAVWRIGKREAACEDCRLCEKHCEGACAPTGQIHWQECVLCLNCMTDCRHGLMTYQPRVSAGGEIRSPDLGRRGFLVSAFAGAVSIPMLRLNGNTGPNWNAELVRPPGALPEEEFLARCIKCGQCMRVCPTNVIHPAGMEAGLETLWTPRLNFRIGTSGCQYNCIACGNLCPTAAIRPLSIDERMGRNDFAGRGPVRIGTAFVDRGRCLPWAMDRPCIVCQENCPVSPKAIVTRETFSTVLSMDSIPVRRAAGRSIELQRPVLEPGRFATGDYYCELARNRGTLRLRISGNGAERIELFEPLPEKATGAGEERVAIRLRLQLPYVNPDRCIGCGVCEHVCPVPGRRAVRVTADNESRDRDHRFFLNS